MFTHRARCTMTRTVAAPAITMAAPTSPKRLQPFDPVVDRPLRTQDEHGSQDLVPSHRFDEGEPVHPGQHDVDDGGVVGLGLCQFEGGLGVDRVVHREAGLPQAGDDERRDRTVVFDYEDPHAGRTERPRGPLMTFKLLRRQMRCALHARAVCPTSLPNTPCHRPAGEHRAAPFEFVRKHNRA